MINIQIQEVLDKFTKGFPVIILDDNDREDEADVIIAAQDITEDIMTFMINHGTGIVCCPMLPERAIELNLNYMVINNTDPHQTAFTVSVDHEDTSTGVSSYDRTLTAKQLSSDNATPQNFKRPGHMFPLIAKPGLLQDRRGHTEASVALCILTGKKPISVITELMNDSGKMLNGITIQSFSIKHNIPIITVAQIAEIMKYHTNSMNMILNPSPLRVSDALIPTSINGREETLTIRAYENVLTNHSYAAVFKTIKRNLRIHSSCFTGDVFHSLRCDCNQQLISSIEYIIENGGIILYCLNHEGRGIGLLNKIYAYKLMETLNIDTYTANTNLGFKIDERDYSDIVYIMENLFGEKHRDEKITLLTGNPKKVNMMKMFGYDIVMKVLPIFKLQHNSKYLNDKGIFGDHVFDFKQNTKNPHFFNTMQKLSNIRVLIVRTVGWNKELMDMYYNNILTVIGFNESIKTVCCTGTMELPQVLAKEEVTNYDLIIALGIIMQGITDHHLVVSITSAVGLQSISLNKNCHIVNGVVLAKNESEVLERISLEKCSILLNS